MWCLAYAHPCFIFSISSLGPLANFFWHNAGFGALRHIEVAQSYQTRYQPLVIPRSPEPSSSDEASLFSGTQDRAFHTSADYVAAYNSGRTTPTDVALYLLNLIKNPPHSLAFAEIREDLTLEAAKESTIRYANGMPKGPLDGVPFIVKDEADVHGYKTTYGSAKVHRNGDGETTWAVKRLQQSGAILIGKANMHELGSGASDDLSLVRTYSLTRLSQTLQTITLSRGRQGIRTTGTSTQADHQEVLLMQLGQGWCHSLLAQTEEALFGMILLELYCDSLILIFQ